MEKVAGRLTVLLGNGPEEGEPWQQTARRLLESQGVGTLVAHTGREAMGLIEESALGRGRRIHVAVLDQRLPVMGGLQILRRLQQGLSDVESEVGASRIPPTILLAESPGAHLQRGLMHEALTARVFSVLPKPIELDVLLDTLARALKRYYRNKWPDSASAPGGG